MLTEEYIKRMQPSLISQELVGKKYIILKNLSSNIPENFLPLEQSLGMIFENEEPRKPDYVIIQLLDLNSFIDIPEGDYDYNGTTYYEEGIASAVFSGQLAARFVNLTKQYKNAIIFCNTLPFSTKQDSNRQLLARMNLYIRKLAKAFGIKIIETSNNLDDELKNNTIKALLYD